MSKFYLSDLIKGYHHKIYDTKKGAKQEGIKLDSDTWKKKKLQNGYHLIQYGDIYVYNYGYAFCFDRTVNISCDITGETITDIVITDGPEVYMFHPKLGYEIDPIVELLYRNYEIEGAAEAIQIIEDYRRLV